MVLSDLLQGRGVVHPLSVLENGEEVIDRPEIFHLFLPEGVDRVEEDEGTAFVDDGIDLGDQIPSGLSRFAVDDPVYRLAAGGGHLLRIRGNLQGRKRPAPLVPGHHLVNGAEGGLVVGGDQLGADAPGVNLAPWAFRLRIVVSSRSLEATIRVSVSPASSSICRARFDR